MFRYGLFVAVAVAAAALGYAAAPANLDTPLTLTPRLLAEIVCVTRSDGVVTFNYDGARDTVVATINPAVLQNPKQAADVRSRTVPGRITPVMAFIRKHVSSTAQSEVR